jgi:hypothetical protein
VRLNPKRHANAGAHRRERTVTEVAPALPTPNPKSSQDCEEKGKGGREGEGKEGRRRRKEKRQRARGEREPGRKGGGEEEERGEGKEGAGSERPTAQGFDECDKYIESLSAKLRKWQATHLEFPPPFKSITWAGPVFMPHSRRTLENIWLGGLGFQLEKALPSGSADTRPRGPLS